MLGSMGGVHPSCPMRKLPVFALVLGLSFGTCHAGSVGVLGLTYGTADAYRTYLAPLIKAYAKASGNTVRLVVAKPSEFNEGLMQSKADIIIGPSLILTQFGDTGIFADVAGVLGPKPMKSIVPGMLDAYYANGGHLGIPLMGSAEILVHNRDLFNKAGVQEPTEEWTWDGKFRDAAWKLTRDTDGDGRNDQYGFLSPPQTIMYGYGASITDKPLKRILYTEAKALKAIEFIVGLYKDGMAIDEEFNPDAAGLPQFPFFDGKSAMRVSAFPSMNNPDFSAMLKGSGVKYEFGFTRLPSGPVGSVTAVHTSFAGMLKRSQRKKEAVSFLGFLTRLEAQKALYAGFKRFPTTYEGLRDKAIVEFMTPPLVKTVLASRSESVRKSYLSIHNLMWADIMRVVKGEGTMADLVRNANSSGKGILEKAAASIF